MFRLIIMSIFILSVLPIQAKDRIRGHFEFVGKAPSKHSLKKVVFEEFLNFGCPHCNHLHEASIQFRKKHKKQIDFKDIPIVFQGQNDAPIRLYYIAHKMGKGDMVKEELYKARFVHGVDVFDKGIVNYLARSLGLYEAYQKDYNAPWVNQLLVEADIKSQQYGITGTPTIVLQYSLKMDIGRYGNMENFVEQLPETILDLIFQ